MDNKPTSSCSCRTLLTVAMVFTCVSLLTPGPAGAQDSFYVRQPEVQNGEAEIEEHGAVLAGTNATEDLRQSHEVEVAQG
jgi:hypothetical protein